MSSESVGVKEIQVTGTPPGTIMTHAYIEAVARRAYLWGWPLVNAFNRASAFEKVPEPGRLGGILPAAPPGTEKESNWLPAPVGANFSLYIRAYWPQQPILNGSWMPPKVQRQK